MRRVPALHWFERRSRSSSTHVDRSHRHDTCAVLPSSPKETNGRLSCATQEHPGEPGRSRFPGPRGVVNPRPMDLRAASANRIPRIRLSTRRGVISRAPASAPQNAVSCEHVEESFRHPGVTSSSAYNLQGRLLSGQRQEHDELRQHRQFRDHWSTPLKADQHQQKHHGEPLPPGPA